MPRLELAPIFKALADENRLAIFRLIRARCRDAGPVSKDRIGETVSDIAKEFELSLSTVSHHLKELKNAGLIRCEKQGRFVHCSVDEEALQRIEKFLQSPGE